MTQRLSVFGVQCFARLVGWSHWSHLVPLLVVETPAMSVSPGFYFFKSVLWSEHILRFP